MKAVAAIQEKVRRFNEDEAVWRCFEEKRQLRDPSLPLPEKMLDEIDWREAERDCRQTRCIGIPLK